MDNPGIESAARTGAPDVTRREFVEGAATVASTASIGAALFNPAPAQAQKQSRQAAIDVKLRVNGQEQHLSVEPRVTLLDALRERLQLTGTKKGCDHGQCGACTVLLNGRRVNSCLTLAVMCDGDEIRTVEGLAEGEQLHALQTAFIKYDGLQCGYCTPGQICSAVALLDEVKKDAVSFATPDVRKDGPVQLTDDEIRERMSGNICRCGAYPNIVAAVRAVYQEGNA